MNNMNRGTCINAFVRTILLKEWSIGDFQKSKTKPSAAFHTITILRNQKPLKTMGSVVLYVEFYVRDVCHYDAPFFPARREQAI